MSSSLASRLTGSMTALITPFTPQDTLDESAFLNLVEWQLAEGTRALVPCGTTGECPTLTDEEQIRLISLCVEQTKGRVPVIAGTGSNYTAHAIYLTNEAAKAGADAALLATPYYNKPTQEGLFQHYKTIHDSTDIPLILYNIPARSVVDLSTDTLSRLAELPRIIGIKDATADLARPLALRQRVGSHFIQLSGEDATVGAFLAQGGVGCISVVSNVAPRLCAELHAAWQRGDLAAFATLRDRLTPLFYALFVETNPAPTKYALSLMGKCHNSLRLPLVTVQEQSAKQIQSAMQQAGLLPINANVAA